MENLILSFLVGLSIDSQDIGIRLDTKDYQVNLVSSTTPYGLNYLVVETTGYAFRAAIPIQSGVRSTSGVLRFFVKDTSPHITSGLGGLFRVKYLHKLDEFYTIERVHFSSGLTVFLSLNDGAGWDFQFVADLNLPPMNPPDIFGFAIVLSMPLN